MPCAASAPTVSLLGTGRATCLGAHAVHASRSPSGSRATAPDCVGRRGRRATPCCVTGCSACARDTDLCTCNSVRCARKSSSRALRLARVLRSTFVVARPGTRARAAGTAAVGPKCHHMITGTGYCPSVNGNSQAACVLLSPRRTSFSDKYISRMKLRPALSRQSTRLIEKQLQNCHYNYIYDNNTH